MLLKSNKLFNALLVTQLFFLTSSCNESGVFTGVIYEDCETKTPFANQRVQIWDKKKQKDLGSAITNEYGRFELKFEDITSNSILRFIKPNFTERFDIRLKPGENLNAEFSFKPEYYIKVDLLANPSSSISSLRYFDLTTRNYVELSAPFNSGILYEGRVKSYNQEYPSYLEKLKYQTDNINREANLNIKTGCSDTITATLYVK